MYMHCCTGDSHTVCLSEDGIVYCFGQNDKGQLGNDNNKQLQMLPLEISNLPKIKQISCGTNFTACVDEQGTVWGFGSNGFGQLGLENNRNQNYSPQKMPSIPPVQSIACGGLHILLITNNSDLWSVGNNIYGQLALQCKESKSKPQKTSFTNISKISAGNMHSIFQSQTGEIFGCGKNDAGQLGLQHCNSPQITISPILNQPSDIVDFCCGFDHNLFLDCHGNVFGVGFNRIGCLGLGNRKHQKLIQKIPNIPPIQTISCAGYSSFLIDFNGNVWVFGANAVGQLGLGTNSHVHVPTKNPNLKNINQISYGCSSNHFLAQDSQNKIFATGNNQKGQLGIGENTQNIQVPKELSSSQTSIWRNNVNTHPVEQPNEQPSIREKNLTKLTLENLQEENKILVKHNQELTEQVKNLKLQLLEIEKKTLEEPNRGDKHHVEKVFNIWRYTHFRDWARQATFNASDFKIIKFLGQGCHGLVMKCELPCNFIDKDDKILVALKMIVNYDNVETKEHVNRTKNEHEILQNSALQLHPNIIRMLGRFASFPTEEMLQQVDKSIRDLCYRRGGIIKRANFFLLEFYDKTLQTVILNENPSKQMIISYAVQIARALLHLYESKIAHLDLKLDNIMISKTNDVVLVDFGCACKLNDTYETIHTFYVGGNENHLAPEILPLQNTDKRLPCKGQFSWELGVILFEMLSKGDLPWDIRSKIELKEKLTTIPNEFHSLLENLLCPPEKRMHIVDAWKYLEDLN